MAQRKIYYRGTRLVGAKLCHHFCDEAGEGWYYPKANKNSFLGVIIGQAYLVDTEGETTTFPKLWYTAQVDGDKHPKTEEWQAEHRVHTQKYKARGATVDPELDKLVTRLVGHVARMSSRDRAHFVTYLLTRFMRFM